MPLHQSKALYKFGFFEGILKKAKFVLGFFEGILEKTFSPSGFGKKKGNFPSAKSGDFFLRLQGADNYLKIFLALYKMLDKCEHCNYSTKRLCDLRRHENRKYPCNRKKKVDTRNLEDNAVLRNNNKNVTDNDDNVTDYSTTISIKNDNVMCDNDN